MLDTIKYLLCQHLRTYILTHHAGILLSHPGVGYLYPPPPPPTTTTHLNKLPLSTIIFRTTDNTKVFLITTKIVLKKYNTTIQYVSIVTASNETLTFYFRFQTTNICYF